MKFDIIKEFPNQTIVIAQNELNEYCEKRINEAFIQLLELASKTSHLILDFHQINNFPYEWWRLLGRLTVQAKRNGTVVSLRGVKDLDRNSAELLGLLPFLNFCEV